MSSFDDEVKEFNDRKADLLLLAWGPIFNISDAIEARINHIDMTGFEFSIVLVNNNDG